MAKCHVEGCQEDAAYGFRRTINTTTFDATGFSVESVFNCCEDHTAETAKAYSGPDVIKVTF
jgi:hypothetical protein